MKEEIKLIKIVLDMLDELTEEEISAIITKNARLKLEFPNTRTLSKSASTFSNDFYFQLENCPSRETAQELFTTSNLKKVELKEIAKHYSIPIGSKENNQQIINKIIETVIGSKIKFNTLLNTNLNS